MSATKVSLQEPFLYSWNNFERQIQLICDPQRIRGEIAIDGVRHTVCEEDIVIVGVPKKVHHLVIQRGYFNHTTARALCLSDQSWKIEISPRGLMGGSIWSAVGGGLQILGRVLKYVPHPVVEKAGQVIDLAGQAISLGDQTAETAKSFNATSQTAATAPANQANQPQATPPSSQTGSGQSSTSQAQPSQNKPSQTTTSAPATQTNQPTPPIKSKL